MDSLHYREETDHQIIDISDKVRLKEVNPKKKTPKKIVEEIIQQKKNYHDDSWIIDIWSLRMKMFDFCLKEGYKYLLVYLDKCNYFEEIYVGIKNDREFSSKYNCICNSSEEYIQCIYDLKKDKYDQVLRFIPVFNYPESWNKNKIEISI